MNLRNNFESIQYLIFVLTRLHGIGYKWHDVLSLQKFDLNQHALAAHSTRAPQGESVLWFFGHRSLDVLHIFGSVVSNQGEVRLQQGPVGARVWSLAHLFSEVFYLWWISLKGVFLQMHNQSLRQLFFALSWDLSA